VKTRRIIIPLDGSTLAESAGRAARSRKADLIVIGTHGRLGLARLLLGSVASRVVALSCPLPSVARAVSRPLTLRWRLPMKRMAWTATAVALAVLVLGPAHAQPGRPGSGLTPDDDRMQQMMNMMQDVQEQMRGMQGRMQGMQGMGSMHGGMGQMMAMMAQMQGMMQQHRDQIRMPCPMTAPPTPK